MNVEPAVERAAEVAVETSAEASASVPDGDAAPLVRVRELVKHFPKRGGVLNRVVGKVHAVNGVSFDIRRGETLGVVGESGCGKSTLGKAMLRLIEPTSGSVEFDGREVTTLSRSEMLPVRRRMQIIFQDPYSSLNPRLTVDKLLREAVHFHGVVPEGEVDGHIADIVRTVGLREEARQKFPHEFSGGQRQRIGIARALALRPEFVVADEPVSALDVSVQASVLNLMMDLKERFGLTMMFISHDLKVIEHFCDRVLVMYLGHVVEELPTQGLRDAAKHPYTRALLGANPIDNPRDRRELTVLKGDVPSPYNPPPGCPFVSRCPLVGDECPKSMPPLERKASGGVSACFKVD